VLGHLQQIDQALRCFSQVLEIDPANLIALVNGGIALAHLGPRIGLVWAGRHRPPINYARDVPLAALRPLLELDADFLSLQREMALADSIALASMRGISGHGEALADFADTAALLAHLDLVIAADTSVVHLAGAMGTPVWVMNRYARCWRWLRGRSDSPWYPTARLFRQTSFGDWAGVIAQIGQALKAALGPGQGFGPRPA
jgi:hypothetical protein